MEFALNFLHVYLFIFLRLERDLETRTDVFGVEVRERVMWDIRQGVIGSDSFVPKHVAIITWKNISFAGGIDNALYKVPKPGICPIFSRIRIDFFFFLLISDKHLSNGLSYGRGIHVCNFQLQRSSVDNSYRGWRRHNRRRGRNPCLREFIFF